MRLNIRPRLAAMTAPCAAGEGDVNARKRLTGIAPAALLSGVFAIIFYRCNTPLGPSIGSDNAMYLTMGTGLARGFAPYVDLFDHKGPLLFLIEMLPQLFFGGYQTLTVFLMEWAVLFACLLVLGAVCNRAGVRCAWPAQLVYLALFAYSADGGNLSEEYANLATLGGLWLIALSFGGERERKRLLWPAAGLGALTMAAFLTRANNALPLIGAALGLALHLAMGRAWKRLAVCAAGVTLGCAVAAAPIVLWLLGEGALQAAFYGAITHNLLYSNADGGSRMQTLWTTPYGHLALLMFLLSTLGALCVYVRTRRRALSLSLFFGAAFALCAAFISHKFYQHYLTLSVPSAALGAALLAKAVRGNPRVRRIAAPALLLVCCASLLLSGLAANRLRLSEREGLPVFTRDAQALYALVPEEDRDSFMAYRVEPKWYVAARALPCMRFYFLQEILAQVDPRVMDEIVQTFETNPPRWLVLFYNRPFSPDYDPRVKDILRTRYVFVDARGEYQLLRLADEG